MGSFTSQTNCSPPPLSTLQLLVPPIRLVSAAIWKTIQQNVVADYGMLEEFVSMVTDIVPELLTTQQRVQLILGLRARLILELCRFDATADIELVQPHLDRVQTFIDSWVMEVDAENMDVPHSGFVDLIKTLLKHSDKKEHFFQKIFPEEFGPTYDEALHCLIWMFLSRLEHFLSLQTFQQVATMLGEVSSVLEECMNSVSQREELKTLLQYQKDMSQLDQNDDTLDGACIISALKLPNVEQSELDKEKPKASIMSNMPLCVSDLDIDSFTLPHEIQGNPESITEEQTSKVGVKETNFTGGENRGPMLLADITRNKGNLSLHQSQVRNISGSLRQCRVRLQRLNMNFSLRCCPVRQNRALRMKTILLEQKRGHCGHALTSRNKRRCKDMTHSDKDSGSSIKESYMSSIKDCSEDDHSNEGSRRETCSNPSTANSNVSEDECSYVTRVRSNPEDNSMFGCSKENPSFLSSNNVSTTGRDWDIKASVQQKTCRFCCFICKKHVNTSRRAHMKIHFPTGNYACPHCNSRFKLYSSFKLHMSRTCFECSHLRIDPEKLHEATNLYTCEKCDMAFRYKVALERHKLIHNDLYCSVCRKVLRDAATLARHKVSHTPFQCNRCEESFTLFKPLLRHCQYIHKISSPFKCNHCPKTLSKLRILIAHEWKHMGRLPFLCAECGLRYKTDADLISHKRVHTREKPYLCAECGKTFSHKSNLLRHLNLIHSESRNEKKHLCSECDKSFKEKGALKKHQRSQHLNEVFRHPCPYCGKMVSASTIARHKLIHTGERPFKCTELECDKDFRSSSEMKRHVLLHHTTERPYKCGVCGKGFIKKCLLSVHAKIHTGEKPFVCHICGKAFPKLYSMQRHKKLLHRSATQ